jgi:hypothetical protein
VPVLSSFKKLRVLDIKDTSITEQGIAGLRQALSDCKILH